MVLISHFLNQTPIFDWFVVRWSFESSQLLGIICLVSYQPLICETLSSSLLLFIQNRLSWTKANMTHPLNDSKNQTKNYLEWLWIQSLFGVNTIVRKVAQRETNREFDPSQRKFVRSSCIGTYFESSLKLLGPSHPSWNRDCAWDLASWIPDCPMQG